MKNLKNYIFEKFKISKDIEVIDHELHINGKLIKIEISKKWNYIIIPFTNTKYGTMSNIYYFKDIKGGVLYLTHKNDYNYYIDGIEYNKDTIFKYKNEKVHINNYGYYQGKNDSYDVIYLNAKDGINFLKNVYLKKDVYELHNYFELEDIDKDIEFRVKEDEINKLINLLK